MKHFVVCSLISVCAAVAIAGCGGPGRPKLVKVTGTVMLDGKPLEGAMVGLMAAGDNPDFKRPSSAVTDAAGKFTPQTYEPGDGLPPGTYKLGIIKRELIGQLPKDFSEDEAGSFNLNYKWITPKSAADPKTSGIEVEVTSAGLSPEVIELKSSGKPEIDRTGPQQRAGEP